MLQGMSWMILPLLISAVGNVCSLSATMESDDSRRCKDDLWPFYNPGKGIPDCCSLNPHQSPRALWRDGEKTICNKYFNLNDIGMSYKIVTATLYNDGKKIVGDVKRSFIQPRLSHSPFLHEKIYKFDKLVFHWGPKGHGSEHSLDGRFYDGEIHFVYYQTRYSTTPTAINKEHGLVIVAVFIEESETQNESGDAVTKIFDKLKDIKCIGKDENCGVSTEVQISEIIRHWNIDQPKYFAYEGTMTGPPCSESVDWVVLVSDIVKMKKENLDKLREVRNADGVKIAAIGNTRELQNNIHPVYANFAC